MLKALLISLVVLLVLAVIGDYALRALGEQRVADSMQRELDLSEEPGVGIDAFPFTTALVGGEFDKVTIDASGVARDDLTLDSTTVTFSNVEFSLGQFLSGDHRRVSIGSGRGTARLSDDDLNTALEARNSPARVEFREGTVLVSSDEIEGEVEAELAIDDGTLTVLPAGASQDNGIQLPDFGGDVTYESVEVQGSTAVLRFTIDSRTVEL